MSALDLVRNPRRSMNLRGLTGDVWEVACELLGLELHRNTASANGTVGGHRVSIAVTGAGPDLRTEYRIALQTPHAPSFTVAAQPTSTDAGLIDLSFDGSVATTTNDQEAMQRFLTSERRTAVQEVLEMWPSARIDNSGCAISTAGVASDAPAMVSLTMKLVGLATSIAPCWADMALDEGSVLADLFNASRSHHQIDARFEDLYRGSEVTWTGEVLQLGANEGQGRLALLLLGSSHGRGWAGRTEAGTMWGGRVVALTVLDPRSRAQRGHVLTVQGGLRSLDAYRRMFRIEAYDSWKPGSRVEVSSRP